MRSRIAVRLAFVAALASVTTGLSCGDGPLDSVGPVTTKSVSGTWQGPIEDLTMRLVLAESSNTVTGTGTMTQQGVPFTLSIAGTTDGSGAFTLNIAEAQHESFTFSGTVSTTGSSRTMTGVGNGAGFVNQPITLTRQ